ncbi:MAG: hypothetical protein FWF29_05385 [Treponema sp.]|nr:hypothetical protein [Treponema sp.]
MSVVIMRIRKFFHDNLSGTRERLIVLACAAALVVLLLIVVILVHVPDNKNRITPGLSDSGQSVIPPEELFLPAEPDFIPGVLLEREKRAVWTAKDAAPYWQDPLKYGEEPWRQQIEKTIDDLMEHVQ